MLAHGGVLQTQLSPHILPAHAHAACLARQSCSVGTSVPQSAPTHEQPPIPTHAIPSHA